MKPCYKEIIINIDRSLPLEAQVLSETMLEKSWVEFGGILEQVLSNQDLRLIECIKPKGKDYYTFANLTKEDFNLVVRLIRFHFLSKSSPSTAQSIWEYTVEPYIYRDKRYGESLI